MDNMDLSSSTMILFPISESTRIFSLALSLEILNDPRRKNNNNNNKKLAVFKLDMIKLMMHDIMMHDSNANYIPYVKEHKEHNFH